jgi:hypothetical protein
MATKEELDRFNKAVGRALLAAVDAMFPPPEPPVEYCHHKCYKCGMRRAHDKSQPCDGFPCRQCAKKK